MNEIDRIKNSFLRLCGWCPSKKEIEETVEILSKATRLNPKVIKAVENSNELSKPSFQ